MCSPVCIAMVAIGGGGFLFVNQSGYSQDYFLFAAIGPLVYLALGDVAA
ncbi:MAG: hypothetical protein VB023_07035 [Oscillibacter sp.]|nr:hypothetical protein [Oscillibacter sp.]